jgi:hypothetical protein
MTMPEKSVIVENHSSGSIQKYSITSYCSMLIKMVGDKRAKKLIMEASIYKKRTFECPRTKLIYTISFPE